MLTMYQTLKYRYMIGTAELFKTQQGTHISRKITKQEPVLLRIKLFSFKALGKHLLSKKKEGSE